MEYDRDLTGYHSVVARPAFCLDARNSRKLYEFAEKYDVSIEGAEIFIRKTELPLFGLQHCMANIRAYMDILIMAVEEEAELEIFVNERLPNHLGVAEEIKGFLEDRTNSANKG